MSNKMDELRARGLQNEGFREGYESRDDLIRMGEMLRQARETSGLTQEALAAKIGMRQPAVSRLESGFGPHGPEMETLLRYAHGCNRKLVVCTVPRDLATPLDASVYGALDVARAYMDMGDPEGARNILDAVLRKRTEDEQSKSRDLFLKAQM